MLKLFVQRHLLQRHLRRVLTVAVISALLTGCDRASAPEKSWEVAVKGTYSAALSSDGKLSVIGSIIHGGSLWQTGDDKRLYDWNHKKGEYTSIIACAFSPEGHFALTADRQTMVLWSTETGKPLTYWKAPSDVLSVALTPEGNYALLGLSNDSVVLFDVKHGGIKRTFYHHNRVRSVAVSANGQLAISGSDDQTAKLWNLKTGKELFSWPHNAEVVTVAIAPNGERALTVAKYDKAVIWNTRTGKEVGELPLQSTAVKRGQTFTSAVFSADGNLLLTGDSDRTVQLWDVNKLTELKRWVVPKRDPWQPTSASIAAVSFTDRQGRYYAVASNGFIDLLTRH